MMPRPGLPTMPGPIQRLPLDHRGYPVPYFAAWLDRKGHAMPRKHPDAKPDFRVTFPGVQEEVLRAGKCWVCGEPLGGHGAFVAGPMCAVNRTSAEPPSHIACARWSARACPFLTLPKAKRRDSGLEDRETPPGVMIRRNPGVALVWIIGFGARPFTDPHGGLLFHMGTPRKVEWYAEGRRATREEVEASVTSGLPELEKLIENDDEEGRAILAQLLQVAEALYPEPVSA